MIAVQNLHYKSIEKTMRAIHDMYNKYIGQDDIMNEYANFVRANQKNYLSYLYYSELYFDDEWVLTFIDNSHKYNLFSPEHHNMMYEALIKNFALSPSIYDKLLLRGYTFTDFDNLDKYAEYKFAHILHKTLIIPGSDDARNISMDTIGDYLRTICQQEYTLTANDVYCLVKLFIVSYMSRCCNCGYDEIQDIHDLLVKLVLTYVPDSLTYEKICMKYISGAAMTIIDYDERLLNDVVRLICEHPEHVSLEICANVVLTCENTGDSSIVSNFDKLTKIIDDKKSTITVVNKDKKNPKVIDTNIVDVEHNICSRLNEIRGSIDLQKLENIKNFINKMYEEEKAMENIIHREYVQIYKAVPGSESLLNSLSIEKLKILENIRTSGIELTPKLIDAICS